MSKSQNQQPRNSNTAVIDLTFTKMRIGGDERVVSILASGETVYPGTMRFCPKTDGKTTYQCTVKIVREGKVAIAYPALWQTLSTKEYLPPEAMRSVLTRPVTFRKENRRGDNGRPEERVIGNLNGRWVFPHRRCEVPIGRPVNCMLLERGTTLFAVPLTQEAESSVTGLVKLSVEFGEVTMAQLAYVTVDQMSGNGEISGVYRNAFEVLRLDPETATAEDVKKAYRKLAGTQQDDKNGRIGDAHPDKVLQPFGGEAKAPKVVVFNAKSFFESLSKARDAALAYLDRKGTSAPAKEASAPAAPAPKPAPVQKPEPVVAAPAPAPVPAPAPAPVATPAPVVAKQDKAPKAKPAPASPKSVPAPKPVDAGPSDQEVEEFAAALAGCESVAQFQARFKSGQRRLWTDKARRDIKEMKAKEQATTAK